MEENNKKNTRIFYVTMAVVLAVVTILIIATVAARRNVPAPDDSSIDTGSGNLNTDTPTIDEEENLLPTFVLPVTGDISIDFSDTVPVFSQTMNDYRTHLGVDISASLGSDVIAVADGTVTNVWDDPFMGTCVSIEHSGNAVSIYKNLDPVVKDGIIIGASVKSGDVIGAIGESAMNEIAEEPHLHYELKVDNKHVDPKLHLNFPKPEEKPSEDSSNTESNK
ncbi:MAG: M23 family metallopeptidase [Clostridia bacterium]|nr:M23 family metallopeptidase [Clostridia bacterium]